jgi:alkaline phosphatase D
MHRSSQSSELFRRINRRSFLCAATSLAAFAWPGRLYGAVGKSARFSDYPFQLGVASGDPSPDGFVLWTRLAPKPLEGGGAPDKTIEVQWQVAADEQMTKVVQKGTAFAKPQQAHTIHVEVDRLLPDRWYWYQFKAGSEVSPKGRSRTLPPNSAMPERLRFAVASCQHFETGYFTAYEHMAKDDIDLVVHLGDYIYEGAGRDKQIRKHHGEELSSLEDYRARYAQYRLDPALQQMHAQVPWIVTWDDHEVDNNYAGAISEEKNVTPQQLLKRRARAYQAYYEHMPLRRSSLPHGPDMQLYRRISFGRLAEFFVLDTRQYRSDQPCGDGNKAPCEEVYNPRATLMGNRQRDWLLRGLGQSTAKWNVLAQQVMMARVDRTAGDAVAYSMDQWPGYEMERRRLLKFFHDRKISNPVVLTGDIHNNWANDLIADFDKLDSRIVGAEFVGTSISSGGNGTREPRNLEKLLSENPFVKFHNNERGYVRCQVTPTEWRADYQTVAYVDRLGAPAVTRATFQLQDGRPGLNKV